MRCTSGRRKTRGISGPYLSANCFGDYGTRTGLDLSTRELPTFAMPGSMGGCEPRLAGHIAGNLHIGNERRVLTGAVTQRLSWIGYPRALNARRLIHEAVDQAALGHRAIITAMRPRIARRHPNFPRRHRPCN